MNKEETLALWQQGKDAWNAWAQEMLAHRAEMEQDGTWAVSREFGEDKPGNEATDTWMREVTVDFDGQGFDVNTDFSHFVFPGSARFNKADFKQGARFESAMFSGGAGFGSATFRKFATFDGATFGRFAQFDGATFSGNARFGGARFSGYASFQGAKFSGHAQFSTATFSEYVWFDSATFSGTARFGSATFNGPAQFDCVTFGGDTRFAQASFRDYATFWCAAFQRFADFTAAQGERTFLLEEAFFVEVPDFIQAHFSEAPRLDNVSIPEVGGIARFFLPSWLGIKAAPSLSARYRALKRLAISGHDHTREQEYFAGELKSLRGYPDRLLPNPLNWFRRDRLGRRLPAWPGGARYWFGLGYEVLSNFGRSMVLPLVWWGVATATFAWAYLAHAVAGDQCVAGGSDSTPWSAALGLSIRKALPFAGIASSEKLNQIYACLYGIHGQGERLAELPDRFTPVIPDAVDYLGMVQLVLSILLLFLFLLAVRSYFRIR